MNISGHEHARRLQADIDAVASLHRRCRLSFWLASITTLTGPLVTLSLIVVQQSAHPMQILSLAFTLLCAVACWSMWWAIHMDVIREQEMLLDYEKSDTQEA